VPRKFVPGVVPEFPVRLQAALTPTGSHATVPSALTILTAFPTPHAPLTRFCDPVESTPSKRSAFRLCTLVVELTTNGEAPGFTNAFSAGPFALFFATIAAAFGSFEFVSARMAVALPLFTTFNSGFPPGFPVRVV
jgi:hypothetical protein